MIQAFNLHPVDPETSACIKLLGAVIRIAVEDAKEKNPDALRFFSSRESPFWEMCNKLGANPNVIIEMAFSSKNKSHQRSYLS